MVLLSPRLQPNGDYTVLVQCECTSPLLTSSSQGSREYVFTEGYATGAENGRSRCAFDAAYSPALNAVPAPAMAAGSLLDMPIGEY